MTRSPGERGPGASPGAARPPAELWLRRRRLPNDTEPQSVIPEEDDDDDVDAITGIRVTPESMPAMRSNGGEEPDDTFRED